MTFTIPLNPVTKKNSQRIVRNGNRSFLLPSKAYEEYEREAIWHLPKPDEPIKTRVQVTGIFYMKTNRIVDLPNLLEALDDVLTAGGVVADDNSRIIASHDGSRVRYDKHNPRTEVTITEVDNDYYPWDNDHPDV